MNNNLGPNARSSSRVLFSDDADIESVDAIQNRLINRILGVCSVLAVPAVAASLWRALDVGWSRLMTGHVVMTLIVWATTIFRRRLSYRVRVLVILVPMWCFGVGSFLSFGLASAGLTLFVVMGVFSVAFLGTRAGLFCTVFCLMALASVGLAVHWGYVTYRVDFNEYMTQRSAWINIGAAALIYMALCVTCLGVMRASLARSIFRLSRRSLELEQTVTTLEQTQEELLQYQKKLRSLANALSMAEEQVRKNVAEFLHENLCQGLVSCKLLLDMERSSSQSEDLKEKLTVISDMVAQLALDAQNVTFDLASPTLDKLGLVSALEEWLDDECVGKHQLEVHFEHQAFQGHLDDQTIVFLFRAIKEMCFNAIKHAQARTVTVCLERRDDAVHVSVSDDGIGFDGQQMFQRTDKGTGLGLLSIRERVDHLGGALQVDSSPGQGTKMRLSLPHAVTCQV